MVCIVAFALLLVVQRPEARRARMEDASPGAEDRARALRALVVRAPRDERILGAAHALERALSSEQTR